MSKEKPKSKFKLSRKTVLTAAIVLAVLVVASGLGVFVSWWQQNSTKSNGGSGITGFPASYVAPSVTKAQGLDGQGLYDQALNSIAKSLTATSDNAEKSDLYMQQGATYMDQNDPIDAVTSFKNAAAIKDTFGLEEAIAQAYAAAGNKQQAIASYNKAISLLDPSKSRDAGLIQETQDAIKGLSK